MKMKQSLIFTFIMCSANISAQVTIGALEEPHDAAILDLSHKEMAAPERGLLMPRVPLTGLTPFQLPTTVADTPEKATGMVVYNLATNAFVCPGLYVWDGSTWNRLMGEACPPYVPSVTIPSVTVCSPNIISPVRFMPYNLGADPQYDTPKKQMEYLADPLHPYSDGDPDASVYGGLYQWGRKDHEHAVNANNFTRYNYADNAWEYTAGNPPPIDANGQPDGAAAGKFIYGADVYYNEYNWYPDAASTTADDTLWGNGKEFNPDGTDSSKGGLLYNGEYYQNTDWANPDNNPCPSGFRVPTQDEWERLINYNCDPSAPNYLYTDNTAGTPVPENGLTWVPVSCSAGQCQPSTSWGSSASGYAIYLTTVWSPVSDSYQAGNIGSKSLHDADAPEPLLFLPAAGYRVNDNGWLRSVGDSGTYWSSTATVSNNWGYAGPSWGMAIYRDQIMTGFCDRAWGNSIRCVEK
jgi:hypothetical protein